MKYQLDSFTYQQMLDSGAYADTLINSFNFVKLLTSEPLWSIFLIFLNKFFSSYFVVFYLIPFLIILLYAKYIYKNSNFFLIFFLIHPIALMFFLNQLRLAFAMAIFLLICTLC
ncbi:EpsG family protein, partial [Acinetobacter bereziniae]|uniref:EpsG family protein n=1 Tax=Acinetobacter bereziniae TaxID=106648 RepID=UPI003F5CD817